MTSTEPQATPPARRRGRRPAGEDTRSALLAAAGEVFVEQGYDGATVRAIATRAGVDAAMVNHWFGGKEGLFAKAVLQLPFDPQQTVAALLAGDRADLAERIVRTFLTIWDTNEGGRFTALVRSMTSHDAAAQALRNFFQHMIFERIIGQLGIDQSDLRASLCASQLLGLGLVRYVLRFEPLASSDVDTVVAAIAPTLQRYLTEPIAPAAG
ncbi:TetR/AcrR family transcriptional regulator [Solihabitans fulvus]|uniref:TetR/AcrR family transcriptional regulator n=1 Tax=Solihabitans fulvus TaxID=1892852 RepID=A0A5B2X6H2_9PSEU|nr:TetR family transcriptional regulator [Solihabitans fulvus]KAA2258731.1 TetR/AcrR family transcriptional regulator [Solihabitans fulvus]